MYDLYFHKSPNTYKISMFFEEAGVQYRTHVVHVGAGEQFTPEFVAISPNSKVPVIRDPEPLGGGEPILVFESGAILLYLAEKLDVMIPHDAHGRAEVLKWLFWQAASFGPMMGQCAHFNMFSPETTYAHARYSREARRLYKVLDQRLASHEFVGGSEYSIADIACYPWTEERPRVCAGLDSIDEYPNIARWSAAVMARPATQRGYQRLREDEEAGASLEEFAMNMFGHSPEQARRSAESARATLERVALQFDADAGAA